MMVSQFTPHKRHKCAFIKHFGRNTTKYNKPKEKTVKLINKILYCFKY